MSLLCAAEYILLCVSHSFSLHWKRVTRVEKDIMKEERRSQAV